MSHLRPRSLDTPHNRKADRRHRRQYRKHKHNPCPHAPRQLDALTELLGTYHKHGDNLTPASLGLKRHNRWTARLRWTEVNTDSDGFPIIVLRYRVEVDYTADGLDWFLASRHTVSAKDDFDANHADHLVVHHIHGNLAYRYRVRAESANCKADWSDYFDLGTPVDEPPAPHDVRILRASHGIRIRWKAPNNASDDEIFTEDIDHFISELWTNSDFGPNRAFTAAASDDKLTITGHGFANGDPLMLSGTAGGDSLPGGVRAWKLYFVDAVTANTFKLTREEDGAAINLTSDGDGVAHWGLVRKAKHIHRHHHRFRIDPLDFDEDVHFYGRVRSVSDHRSKSAWIPATAPVPNDDPGATPTGRRPLWHRHGGLTFTIPGAVREKTYKAPHRMEDDYIIRRVTAAADRAGAGGSTHFDIKINGSPYVFGLVGPDEVHLDAGDKDGSSKSVTNAVLSRGDHIRVRCTQVAPTPPRDVTVHIVADRLAPRELAAADSGGGGGSTGPVNDDFEDALEGFFNPGIFGFFNAGRPDITDLTGASKEPGEPDHAGDAGGHSVWFAFQPDATTTWTIEVDSEGGSTNPALLGVYTGVSVDALSMVPLTGSSNGSLGGGNNYVTQSYSLIAGVIYWVAVDGQGGEVFAFDIYAF